MPRYYIKDIPIADLDRLRPYYRTLAQIEGKKLRIRFRGPRYDRMRQTCLKKDARTFAVYFD